MDFNVNVGLAGWALLIIGGLVLGVFVQLIGQADFGYEWVLTAIGGVAGVVVTSEFIVGLRSVEPVWDGLALIPALVGGIAVGAAVAIVTRLLTGGSFTARTAS